MEEVNNNLKQPHRVALQDFFFGGGGGQLDFWKGAGLRGCLGEASAPLLFFPSWREEKELALLFLGRGADRKGGWCFSFCRVQR